MMPSKVPQVIFLSCAFKVGNELIHLELHCGIPRCIEIGESFLGAPRIGPLLRLSVDRPEARYHIS